jgi:hypothetical protein
MVTMMDLTDYATRAWGPSFNLANLSANELAPLINAKPSACGNWVDGTWQDLPRGKNEAGNDWCERKQSMEAVGNMLAKDKVSVCMYIHANICIYVCLRTCVYVFVHINVYI